MELKTFNKTFQRLFSHHSTNTENIPCCELDTELRKNVFSLNLKLSFHMDTSM